MAEAKRKKKIHRRYFWELDLLARSWRIKKHLLSESFRLYRQGMELLKDLNGKTGYCRKKDASDEWEDGTFREF